MARTINFDFTVGGVVAEGGKITMAGTHITTVGATINLPPVQVAYLSAGVASIPGVAPTPVGGAWKYQVKLEPVTGGAFWWIVEVPDLTTPVNFSALPVTEAIAMPIDQTGTQIETWMQSIRAQAAAANANATNALQQIQNYHGIDAEPPRMKTADTWEELKLIIMSDGTIKGIPLGDMPPGQPTIGSATPGSTMVKLLWTLLAQATNYKLFRNGIQVYSGADDRYTDRDVVSGTTYTYTLIAYDRHGQRSATSASITAGSNPSLNVSPTVAITTWPSPLPQSGSGLIRVAASDIEAQHLIVTLAISTGTITPTRDPSVWKFVA